MSIVDDILSASTERGISNYHFKVTALSGNQVTYRNASKKTNNIEMKSEPYTMEDMYAPYLDGLFISIDISGQAFLYTKVSNDYNLLG